MLRLFKRLTLDMDLIINNFKKKIPIHCPPKDVKNMKIFNEKLFNKTIKVPVVKVQGQCVKKASIILAPFSLKMAHLSTIQTDPQNENFKMILLDPEKIINYQALSQEDKNYLSKHCNVTNFNEKEIDLTFENYTIDSIMKALFEEEKYRVTGWSVIGHILHVNLKPHVLPKKEMIGEILLRKNRPLVKTVVNKTTAIDNQFRNFNMEVIAQTEEGKKLGTIVKVRALKCTYQFDFAKVYWNPRLNTEHERIINKLTKKLDVVYDMFAGIGPFAIPAAKGSCKVLANDLNPEAHKWLLFNSKLNKTESYLKAYNMDARDFVQKIVKFDLIQEWKRQDVKELDKKPTYHILMNLPKLAFDFLDVFQGLMSDQNYNQLFENIISPVIHCYHFIDEEPNYKASLISKIEKKINHHLKDENIIEIKSIRTVAPNRFMYRVSFILPKKVLFIQVNKRQKVS